MPDETAEEDMVPLNVKVINTKEKPTNYDSTDCSEYDEMLVTADEIKEFEDGDNTSTKKE